MFLKPQNANCEGKLLADYMFCIKFLCASVTQHDSSETKLRVSIRSELDFTGLEDCMCQQPKLHVILLLSNLGLLRRRYEFY